MRSMPYGSSGYGSGGYGSGNKYGSNTDNDTNYTDNNQTDDYSSDNHISTKKHSFTHLDGVIAGYEIEDDNTGFFMAWLKSLIYGIPFVTKSQKHIFQLMEDEFDSSGACNEVHLLGEIDSGKLNNGERVIVFGTKTGNGAYLAKKIVKANNGMRVTLKKAIPAMIIRVVTLFVLIAIFGLISSFSNSDISAMQGIAATDVWKKILAVVIVVLAVAFGGKLRDATGLSPKILWIVVAIAVGLLIPEVGATILILCLVFWVLKRLISGK